MNKRELAQFEVLYEKLADVFDTLESQSDSDLDFFEDEEEERECAPLQYSARNIMIVMEKLEKMVWGAS